MFKGLTIAVPFVYGAVLSGRGHNEQREMLLALARLMEDGALRVLVDDMVFDLEQLGDAFKRVDAREKTGKVVVNV